MNIIDLHVNQIHFIDAKIKPLRCEIEIIFSLFPRKLSEIDNSPPFNKIKVISILNEKIEPQIMLRF